MNPRFYRTALVISGVVLLLFAGRWTSSYLAERWWAAEISPAAARFVSGWNLLSGLLEGGGILAACAWFIGHLLLVYRAIGSVQIHRRLGNLEIQEAVNLRALAALCVGGGVLFGLLAGRGLGDWAGPLLLARGGLSYGELDPLLGRDLGYYMATLPLLERVQGHLLILTALGLAVVLTAYAIIGAIRRIDQRLAINDHARWHLGVLAVLLGLVLAWGYALEPARLAGGAFGSVYDGLFPVRRVIALTLTGVALAASCISLWWSFRGGHALLGAAWGILAASLLLGHYVIPALVSPRPMADVTQEARRRLDQLAYGMTSLREAPLVRAEGVPAPPHPMALLTPTIAADATGEDSTRVVSLDRAALPGPRGAIPGWLVVRAQPGGSARVLALRDDRTLLDGRPEPMPASGEGAPIVSLPIGRSGSWPRGQAIVVDTVAGGVPVGSGIHRVALAWALQTTAVLGPMPRRARVFWHLDPADRLGRLAPFAAWGAPRPRIIDGELVWLVDGYLPVTRFPGSTRLEWRGEGVGGLQAAFLGVVRANGGGGRIFLRHSVGELGKSWLSLAGGVIEPSSAMPAEVLRNLSYPSELLEAQVRVLGMPHWGIGVLPGRPASVGVSGPPPEAFWKPDGSGIGVTIPYLTASQRQVAAVVQCVVADGWEQLRVVRVDSLLTLPEPSALQGIWGRFPTYLQLRDSVEREGGRLDPSPIRFWVDGAGLGAYEVQFARKDGTLPTLVWVSIAHGERRGAGHDAEEAWQNLLGLGAPLVGGAERAASRAELRRLAAMADSALRAGDLEAFGRHWAAILRLLRRP